MLKSQTGATMKFSEYSACWQVPKQNSLFNRGNRPQGYCMSVELTYNHTTLIGIILFVYLCFYRFKTGTINSHGVNQL